MTVLLQSWRTVPVVGSAVGALVDSGDYPAISAHCWHLGGTPRRSALRVERTGGKSRTIYMHRQILGVTENVVHVDHKNRNTLDNRRGNLRFCTRQQNMWNRRKERRAGASQFKGVSWRSNRQKWNVHIATYSKRVYVGSFSTEQEAALAYDAAARIHHGPFARLNFPLDGEQGALE
jgi:hypothetical protein